MTLALNCERVDPLWVEGRYARYVLLSSRTHGHAKGGILIFLPRPCSEWSALVRAMSASRPLFPSERTFISAVCTSAQCH